IHKNKMAALRRQDRILTSSRKAMEKIICDYYSNLFGSHVRLPPCNERKDDYVVPNVLPSEIRYAIPSIRNRTAPGIDRIRPEHLKNLPPVIIKTLARLFTRFLSDCKVPSQCTMDHIHTITRLIEVSREYKKPLCLTFIDLKKAFDSVETEAVMEALTNQPLPTLYIKILRELYKNFTSKIIPLNKGIMIYVKREV
ncbi:hypothetical protein DICVIV_08596, partial [Dictyocaulus viviparus]